MNLNDLVSLFSKPPFSQNHPIKDVVIDSRRVSPGSLFVAIKGEQFDGHDFIEEVAEKGAIAVITEREITTSLPQVLVADTIAALAKIAAFHRQQMAMPIIALTGSNGKTSVKEMIASILPKPSHATKGNYNNHIGAPLSVLALEQAHRYAVFELGANHKGEIAYTVDIVKPDVALINNIAPAHIEGFGSIDGVALAKGEIYEGLAKTGTAIVNDDDNYAHFWDEILKDKKVLRFSLHKKKDVFAENLSFDVEGLAKFDLVLPNGRLAISLNVPGEHTVRNALAAAACCYAAGIELSDIEKGLCQFSGVQGRMTFLKGKNEAIVIDDTYNANLRSVLTAVDVLAKRQGKRILVLGDMGELGSYAKEHHEEVGKSALDHGIDILMTCGINSLYSSQAFGEHAKHYANQQELANDLLTKLDKNTTILVKGSRSAAMEKVVHQLLLI